MTYKYDEVKVKEMVKQISDKRYDERVTHFTKEIRTLGLPHSVGATSILLKHMSADEGFARHDGQDYFIHPIAVAQTALDFKVVSELIARNELKLADLIITSCLLHDIAEDVPGFNKEVLTGMFDEETAQVIDNLTKREGEAFELYIERAASHPVSALVKVLDRLNNVSTLASSSLEHRIKQLHETRLVYIPLSEAFRRQFWEFGDLFWQAKTIMESILAEVERSIIAENKVAELEAKIRELEL